MHEEFSYDMPDCASASWAILSTEVLRDSRFKSWGPTSAGGWIKPPQLFCCPSRQLTCHWVILLTTSCLKGRKWQEILKTLETYPSSVETSFHIKLTWLAPARDWLKGSDSSRFLEQYWLEQYGFVLFCFAFFCLWRDSKQETHFIFPIDLGSIWASEEELSVALRELALVSMQILSHFSLIYIFYSHIQKGKPEAQSDYKNLPKWNQGVMEVDFGVHILFSDSSMLCLPVSHLVPWTQWQVVLLGGRFGLH